MENLKNANKKVKEYYKRASQAQGKVRGQKQNHQLKATNEPQAIKSPKDLRDPPLAYKQFAPPLDWNLF